MLDSPLRTVIPHEPLRPANRPVGSPHDILVARVRPVDGHLKVRLPGRRSECPDGHRHNNAGAPLAEIHVRPVRFELQIDEYGGLCARDGETGVLVNEDDRIHRMGLGGAHACYEAAWSIHVQDSVAVRGVDVDTMSGEVKKARYDPSRFGRVFGHLVFEKIATLLSDSSHGNLAFLSFE